MEMKSDKRYFNFPLMFIKNAHTNIKKVMDDIMYYCIVKYAEDLPETEGNLFERVQKAALFFGITISDSEGLYSKTSLEFAIENGKKLVKEVETARQTGESIIYTDIDKYIAFEFYKNSKSNFDIDCLLMFLAVRSLTWNKSFIKTTNKFLLYRMAGFGVPKGELPEELKKYADGTGKIKRYSMEKLKLAVMMRYPQIQFVGIKGKKGLYVTSKLSLEQLIDKIYNNKSYKTRMEERRIKINQLIKQQL